MHTDIKKNTRTKQVLGVVKILAWLAFIGFSIEAGAILISYGVSCVNPVAAKNLYKGLNLYTLQQFSFWHYSLSVFFRVAILSMKSSVAQMAIKALSKVNLANPFTLRVARIMEKMSYMLLAGALIAFLNNIHAGWLLSRTGIQVGEQATEEFLFIAGLIFVISQVFKRGVEIQSENDLTI